MVWGLGRNGGGGVEVLYRHRKLDVNRELRASTQGDEGRVDTRVRADKLLVGNLFLRV
jgi:hypothetical protein